MTIMLVGLMSATRTQTHHEWVHLPGYPNVLVDMASVKLGNGPFGATVNIRINGHHREMWTFCGPKQNFAPGDDRFTTDDGHGEQKLIGTIPNGAVEALICPGN